VRDIVMANFLGASWVSDVFLVAQKIPNFLRRLFAEGAFSQAFVPVLAEYQTNEDVASVKRLISQTSGTLALILVAVTLLGVVGSPVLATLFGPGFLNKPAEQFELLTLLLKITFPYILFVSLTAFCGSVLNSVGRFAAPAFTPVLLNLSIISAAILTSAGAATDIAFALAWGVFAAGVIQLLFLLPFLWREGLLVPPSWGWRSPGVQKILNLMGPALFGVSVAQINLLLDTVLASLLPAEGSITWLYYSDRLMEFPLGMFGIAIATVILPSLSRQHAADSHEAFNATMNWALRLVFLIGTPALLGIFILAEPLLLTVFQHGEFMTSDAHSAMLSLRAYISGLLGFMLIKVLATGFYSRQDTKTPVKIAVIALMTNMIFNLLLFYPLAHVGLALATAISGAANAGLLFWHLRKHGYFRSDGQWLSWFCKLLVANVGLIAYLLSLTDSIEVWQSMSVWERIKEMAWLVPGAVVVYAVIIFATGIRLSDLRHEAV